jgi:enterochelin esterase-like enzyme
MNEFRTIEISNPLFESDFLRYITVKSENLKGRGDICVFVPPGTDPSVPCPLVILLHGVYGSSWSWSLSGGVHRTALQLIRDKVIPPMVIAMPSDGLWGDGSGYVPHHGFHFEKWISDDVPRAVKACIPEVSDQSKMFIGGLSMGGFGAMMITARHPGLFSGVAAHSSLTSLGQMKLFVEEDVAGYGQGDAAQEDVLSAFLKNKTGLPPLYFDCGLSDSLLEANRLLHRELLENQIGHDYVEYAGGHQWEYWQEHAADALRFFSRHC